MLDIGALTAHSVTVYTSREVFPAAMMVPSEVRFSSWLADQEGTLQARATIDGIGRDILLNRPYLEAVVDELPPYVDPSAVRASIPTRVAISFGSGLRITGNLHLSAEAEFESYVHFGAEDSLRVITDAAISLRGITVRDGAVAIVNLDRAVYVARL